MPLPPTPSADQAGHSQFLDEFHLNRAINTPLPPPQTEEEIKFLTDKSQD